MSYTEAELKRHNDFILQNPFGSYYQTTWFAETKKLLGYPTYLLHDLEDESGAVESSYLAWLKPIPHTPFSYAYVRTGFTLDYDRPDWEEVLQRLWQAFLADCHSHKIIYMRFDLPVPDTRRDVYDWFAAHGVKQKSLADDTQQTFFRFRAYLDVSGTMEEFLTRLPKKTRSQINRTEKFGLSFEEGSLDDFADYYAIRKETALRDGIALEPEKYLREQYRILLDSPMAKLYFVRLQAAKALELQQIEKDSLEKKLARIRQNQNPKQNQIDELESQLQKVEERMAELRALAQEYPRGLMLSGCLVFTGGDPAEYHHACSSDNHRDYLPNYFMVKNVVRLAQESGAKWLDMGGTGPDSIESGLSSFKKNWGTTTVGLSGDMEYSVNKVLGQAFGKLLSNREEKRRQNHGTSGAGYEI